MQQNEAALYPKHALQEYYGFGPGTGNGLSTALSPILIPKNAGFIFGVLVGAGSGGGGGGAAVSGTADTRGGGGGGGGTVVTFIMPTCLLPEYIFPLVGQAAPGGSGQVQGGAASVAGFTGAATGLSPQRTITNAFLSTGSGAGGNGGAAGSGGQAGTSGSSVIRGGGITRSQTNNGVAGTGTAAGANMTNASSPSIVSGGAGGGGIAAADTPFAGGDISAIGTLIPVVPGGTAGGGAGRLGQFTLHDPSRPCFSQGGSGGGATNAGTGAAGGNAYPGSGGGGGGAAHGAGQQGGRGGNSGPGFIHLGFL